MPSSYFTRNMGEGGPRLIKSLAGGSAGWPDSASLQQEAGAGSGKRQWGLQEPPPGSPRPGVVLH